MQVEPAVFPYSARLSWARAQSRLNAFEHWSSRRAEPLILSLAQ
jgi:hypothetical protein